MEEKFHREKKTIELIETLVECIENWSKLCANGKIFYCGISLPYIYFYGIFEFWGNFINIVPLANNMKNKNETPPARGSLLFWFQKFFVIFFLLIVKIEKYNGVRNPGVTRSCRVIAWSKPHKLRLISFPTDTKHGWKMKNSKTWYSTASKKSASGSWFNGSLMRLASWGTWMRR